MKLTNILLLAPLITRGTKAQQNYSGPGEIGISGTNEAASPGHASGNSLARREEGAWWDDFDDDQEKCTYADATNTIGSRVILKRHCQRLADYFAIHPGRWVVSGWHWGDDVWAPLAYSGTCSFEVARVDGRDEDFE